MPVLPTDSLNRSVEWIGDHGYDRGVLATVSWQHSGHPRLVWLAVELVGSGQQERDSHLPTTPSTTIGDMLRILNPGASMTIRLESGEMVLQPTASSQPIAYEQALESLQELAPA